MKKAFTMLELIFVLVVIGILAAVMMPNTKTNRLYEAAQQVVAHIRYTQHLAMIDDQYNSSDADWYKARWQIFFTRTDDNCDNKICYSTGYPNSNSKARQKLDKLGYKFVGSIKGYNMSAYNGLKSMTSTIIESEVKND